MQTQQKVARPSRSGISFPEGEHPHVSLYNRTSLVSACRGNERMAGVLDYLLYRANWELENQHLPEGCKVVVLSRTHQQILEKLTFNLSRKSLIGYLDVFNDWGFVTSEKFRNEYTVHFDTVQAAIDTPPPAKERKSRSKGCKVEALSSIVIASTLAEKVEELQQKVELLQRKVEELQPLVCNTTTLQRAFSALVETLQGHSEKDLSLLLSYYYPLLNDSLVASATTHTDFKFAESEKETISRQSADNQQTLPVSLSVPDGVSRLDPPLVESVTPASSGKRGKAKPVETPKELTEPDMTGAWNDELVVQYAEWCNGRRYEAASKMRVSQLKAASKLHKEDSTLTMIDYKKAHDKRYDDWWKEHRRVLHVSDMAAKDNSGIVRVYAMLDKIETDGMQKLQRATLNMQAQPAKQNGLQPTYSLFNDPNLTDEEKARQFESEFYHQDEWNESLRRRKVVQ